MKDEIFINLRLNLRQMSDHFQDNPKQELRDFLDDFGIRVENWFDNSGIDITTHPSMYLQNGMHKFTPYYKVLLETIRLLSKEVYTDRTFTRLYLWGENPCHSPTDFGFFTADRSIVITEKALSHATPMGLAYTFLHELGHSVEHLYPKLPTRPLPGQYYEQRDESLRPGNIHDLTTGDLLNNF